MIFIKSINELFDSESYDFELVKSADKYWKYLFKTDKHEYMVEFKYGEFGWEACHSTLRGYSSVYQHFYLAYDNTLKVTKTIITVLQDFLDKKDPKSVFIAYIPTIDDKSKKSAELGGKYVDVAYNTMNKRARLQSFYLKNLQNYKIKYYYKISNSYLVKTIGFIYRNDVDPKYFTDKIVGEFRFEEI